MNILLVDDDVELCSLLSEFLTREGFHVECVNDGNGGLERALQPGIDRANNILGTPTDVVFQHNTMIPAASTPCVFSVFFPRPQGTFNVTNNLWLLDNVMCNQPTGDGGLQGTSGLNFYMGMPSTPPNDLTQRFFGNVMFVPPGNNVQTFPPHNLATTVPFIYVNPPRDNYQLLIPKWTGTTDGLITGINNSSLPTMFLP